MNMATHAAAKMTVIRPYVFKLYHKKLVLLTHR